MNSPIPLAVAARFALLIDWLCGTVAEQHCGGRFEPRSRPLAGPIILLIWQRLRRMALRFAHLAARIEAGANMTPRRRKTPRHKARAEGFGAGAPDPAAPDRARSGGSGGQLPRGFCWLIGLVQPAACYASAFVELLAEPEMVAMRAAAPQMDRLLHPLCRMLGIACPPNLAVAGLPISDLPTSDVPTSDLPTSDVPISDVPMSDLPTSGLPTSGLPTSGLPTSDLPTPDPTESDQLARDPGVSGPLAPDRLLSEPPAEKSKMSRRRRAGVGGASNMAGNAVSHPDAGLASVGVAMRTG